MHVTKSIIALKINKTYFINISRCVYYKVQDQNYVQCTLYNNSIYAMSYILTNGSERKGYVANIISHIPGSYIGHLGGAMWSAKDIFIYKYTKGYIVKAHIEKKPNLTNAHILFVFLYIYNYIYSIK